MSSSVTRGAKRGRALPNPKPDDINAAHDAYASLANVDWGPLKAETSASDALLEDYKKFLALKAAESDFYAALLSPSPQVDEVWHAHILDTLAYKEACEAMLGAGGFIHHDPRGGRDAAARRTRLRRTLSLYEVAFGKPLTGWPELAIAPPVAPATVVRPVAPATGGSSASGSMQIFVEDLTGNTHIFDVYPSDAIIEFKEQIKDKTSIPTCQQRLSLMTGGTGKQLEDDKTVSDYNIQNKSVILLILRLAGC